MDETTTVAAPQLGSEGEHCPQCSAALTPDQRYCLNCGRRRAGQRLPFLDIVEADAQAAQVVRAPGAPALASRTVERSPLVALASLIALLLALGIGVLIGRGSSSPSQATAKAPVVNLNSGAGGAAPAAFTGDWPSGTSGYTVMLSTLSATATAAEVATAKQAAGTKGASAVGALLGSQYPTVGEAGIVVYSGVFTTRKLATTALKDLTASFPEAKVVRVSDSAASSSAGGGDSTVTPDPSAKPIPKGGSNLTPQEYQKRSKKLPDKVQSQGAPPKKDNKKPGGGSKGTTIG